MERYDEGWVARYVEGELSGAELSEFEEAMAAVPALAASVALYREIQATLQRRLPEDKTKTALEQRLTGLNKEYFEVGAERAPVREQGRGQDATGTLIPISGQDATRTPAPVRRLPRMRGLSIAAAIVCIAVGVYLLSRPSLDTKLQELGKIEMTGVAERGANTDTLLQQAAVFFNQQKFAQALPLLNQVVAIDTTSQLALFYRGVAAWHTGDLALARLTLTQVYNNGSLLKNQAALYMALTYAKEDKRLALEWLYKIPSTEPEYMKAKALEDAIK